MPGWREPCLRSPFSAAAQTSLRKSDRSATGKRPKDTAGANNKKIKGVEHE